MTSTAPGHHPRRSVVARSLGAALLVVLVGAALGFAWHRLMPPRLLWQPGVSKAPRGWLIRDRGLECSGLAASASLLAWLSDENLLVMDLSDGAVRRIARANTGEALSEPAVCGETVYWAAEQGSGISTDVHGDLGSCRLYAWDARSGRRTLLASDRRSEYYALSASDAGVAWVHLERVTNEGLAYCYDLAGNGHQRRRLLRTTTENDPAEPQLAGGVLTWTSRTADGKLCLGVVALPSGRRSSLQLPATHLSAFAADAREAVLARQRHGRLCLYRCDLRGSRISLLGGALAGCEALRLTLAGDELILSELLPDGGLRVLAEPRTGGGVHLLLRRGRGSACEPAVVAGETVAWMHDQTTIAVVRSSP